MKIKTITCQHVHNYGATLQAYALQSYLESCHHSVEVIDYRRPGHTRYEMFAPIYDDCKASRLIKKYPYFSFILTTLKNAKQFRTWGRKGAFERFDRKYLHLTQNIYRNLEELQSAEIDADVLIAGSDQIWNTDMGNGTDRCYYLDFGKTDVIRISYAASFGISQLPNSQIDFVRKQLSRFDCLSVREKSGVHILQNQLYLEGIQVCDPVFLLSRVEWISRLQLEYVCKPYIFVYDFGHNNSRVKMITQQLSKEKGLKIVALNDLGNTPYADVQVNNAGPIEFLQYLLSASYVISMSFHATAFSVIFQKNFVTFPLISQRNPTRMTDLLEKAGLMNRFAPESIYAFESRVDWDEVETRLISMIKSSKTYLSESIVKKNKF